MAKSPRYNVDKFVPVRPSNTKLSQELIARTYRLLRNGNYDTVARDILGIHQETWYKWLREGKEVFENPNTNLAHHPDYLRLEADFWYVVQVAKAEAEDEMLQRIRKASRTHWQAAAWILERRYRERWGKEQQSTNIKVDVSPYVEALNAQNDTLWDDSDKAAVKESDSQSQPKED